MIVKVQEYKMNENHSSPREDNRQARCADGNQGREHLKTLASSREQVTTRRVPRVGVLVGYTKDLNEFRKAYLVLVNIM